MEVWDIAAAAVDSGELGDPNWGSFEKGEARAVAMDVQDDCAAVLVIRRFRNDDWKLDVVPFLRTEKGWEDLGSSGTTASGWPPQVGTGIGIGPTSTSWSALDDDGLLAAAGFAPGPAEFVELHWSGGNRRVRVGPSRAFVIVVRADEGEDFDLLDLVALSADGAVVASAAEQRAARDSKRGMTVADALRRPAGTEVTIEATLLALPGQRALLCDGVSADPPRARGASVEVGIDNAPFPIAESGDGWVSAPVCLVTGVIVDGVFSPTGS